MNDRSFKDREKTLEKIKTLFFNTLYLWTAVFVSSLVTSYHNFLTSLEYFLYTWRRLTLLMISRLLIKKKRI
jgi:purine-cytosine permease-like protein